MVSWRDSDFLTSGCHNDKITFPLESYKRYVLCLDPRSQLLTSSSLSVTDYDLGGITILYSTAEIFTWQKFGTKTVLFVYGGPGELHELSVVTTSPATVIEGSGLTTKSMNSTTILNWQTTPGRRVVQIGDLFVYIYDRNTAYNLWVPEYTSSLGNSSSVIVEAGYLVRSASIQGTALHIYGDLNATVPIKVIGAPAETKDLHFNGEKLNFSIDPVTGEWSSTLDYAVPEITLPNLANLSWKFVDDLVSYFSSRAPDVGAVSGAKETYSTICGISAPKTDLRLFWLPILIWHFIILTRWGKKA
jgi:hypothetical protein